MEDIWQRHRQAVDKRDRTPASDLRAYQIAALAVAVAYYEAKERESNA